MASHSAQSSENASIFIGVFRMADTKLSEDLQPILEELQEDYKAASKIHAPNYKGGPNKGILSELIRMGWRKKD
jgi:hypothetical protein